MNEIYCLLLGGTVYFLLGSLHLAFTFFGRHFQAREQRVVEAMQSVAPRITAQTTMWRAWIGFNASHSLGAIVLGLFVIVMALDYPTILLGSGRLLALVNGASFFYLFLAWRYWFRTPLIGIGLATGCFLAATWIGMT